jgi:hypothetical protein
MMDPDEEEYSEVKAKLWRSLLSGTSTRLCWRFDEPIGASKVALTSFICYDVQVGAGIVHCYPVIEADARDIMANAELVTSDDYYRPESL